MAKVLLLVCAAAPRPPEHYLAALPRVRALFRGASWQMAMLGAVQVSVERPTKATRELYRWPIGAALRFAGMAKPKRDWVAIHALAEAVLADVGGALVSRRVVLARLPAEARADLGGAVERALGDARRLREAITDVFRWEDPVADAEVAARVEEAIRAKGDAKPYELLAQLARGDADEEPAAAWLRAPEGDTTRLGEMLERAERAGLRLRSLAREHLREERRRKWVAWAWAHGPAEGDAEGIVAGAEAREARALVVLSTWCERHGGEGPDRAALVGALTHASAERGPWPPVLREAVTALLQAAADDPLPVPGAALCEADARWLAELLAARAVERRRYAELIAGIEARNAEMHRRMSGG